MYDEVSWSVHSNWSWQTRAHEWTFLLLWVYSSHERTSISLPHAVKVCTVIFFFFFFLSLHHCLILTTSVLEKIVRKHTQSQKLNEDRGRKRKKRKKQKPTKAERRERKRHRRDTRQYKGSISLRSATSFLLLLCFFPTSRRNSRWLADALYMTSLVLKRGRGRENREKMEQTNREKRLSRHAAERATGQTHTVTELFLMLLVFAVSLMRKRRVGVGCTQREQLIIWEKKNRRERRESQ